MIGKLRIKLIIASMVSLLTVLLVIMTAINLLNYFKIVSDADSTLTLLAENDGAFPGGGRIQPPPDEDFAPHAPHLSPEFPYETRYFFAVLDADGTVASVNTGKIAAVDTSEAIEYAQCVWQQGKTQGFLGSYRFLRSETTAGQTLILFLDCRRSLDTARTLLLSCLGVSTVGSLLVLLLLIFLELKYLLDATQKQHLLEAMQPYMALDDYGRTTIRNIYFDTDSFRLIRRSLEKPAYKEKLRIRSYRQADSDDPVFVELKKKYQSVVYKRRLSLPEGLVMDSFAHGAPLPVCSQIGAEIAYFRAYYRTLRPAVFLSYEREAFYALDSGPLRITLDENILYRRHDLSLGSPVYGAPLLEDGQTLLEVKTAGGLPLWLSHVLTENGIYKTSFSKYGTAYCRMMENETEGGLLYA